MKILYIANARIPTEKTNGKQIMKTCEALANTGQEVELWLPRRKQSQNLKNVNPFNFYRVLQIFKIRHFFTIDLLHFSGEMPNLIDLMAYLLQELSFVLSILLALKQVFQDKIVYTRCLSAAVAIKLFKKNRVFYEAHNIGSNELAKRFYFFLVSTLDGLVVISEGLRKEFTTGGISKITVISGSVDVKEIVGIDRLAARKKLGFKDKKIVVYTGRLAAPKGVYSLVKAAKIIVPKEKNITFYLVGDSTKNDLEKLGKLSPGENRIKFIGPIASHEYFVYQRAADVLVLPGSAQFANSREYTSPLKLFEYLASGVPMVATDVPANTAILTHKVNAYLVSPDDPDSLAAGIMAILNDKKLARDLPCQARKDANNYTWKKRAQKIIEFVKANSRNDSAAR